MPPDFRWYTSFRGGLRKPEAAHERTVSSPLRSLGRRMRQRPPAATDAAAAAEVAWYVEARRVRIAALRSDKFRCPSR